MIESDEQLLAAVSRWLRTRDREFDALQLLTGDVSPRRYVRLHQADGGSAIVSFYPAAARETGERFKRTTALLSRAGILVPEILEWDAAAGMMLLEDAGDRSVYDAVSRGQSCERHLRLALEVLERVGERALDEAEVDAINPRLGRAVFERELQQSWDLVLEPRGLTGDGPLAEEFKLALSELGHRLAGTAARPCHRDFMARNLLLEPDGCLVVIDHQDLRLGPPWYDLASLLNDSVYATPSQEARLLDLARVARPEREAYHRAAAQRTLKIVGTFAAFAERGFSRHLQLVAPSLAAARRHLARLPETAPLMRDLAERWDRAGIPG